MVALKAGRYPTVSRAASPPNPVLSSSRTAGGLHLRYSYAHAAAPVKSGQYTQSCLAQNWRWSRLEKDLRGSLHPRPCSVLGQTHVKCHVPQPSRVCAGCEQDDGPRSDPGNLVAGLSVRDVPLLLGGSDRQSPASRTCRPSLRSHHSEAVQPARTSAWPSREGPSLDCCLIIAARPRCLTQHQPDQSSMAGRSCRRMLSSKRR